jgi:hypothetical protein
MFRKLILACFLLSGPFRIHAGEWHVSTDGTPTNAGTSESSWDLTSALAGNHGIKPGDTIWIRGGNYRHPWTPGQTGLGFQLKLRGAKDAPILVRGLPKERVTLDGLQVVDPAEFVWVRDIEIAGSIPEEKRITGQKGSSPTDLPGPIGGLNIMTGKECKYINLVIHDNAGCGVGFWKSAIDSEIYGCIIYGNGWKGPDRMHGHCIYTQNETGFKTISDCILTTPYGDGQQTVQAYGSSRAFVDNFVFRNNVAYDKGRFLVGGGRPSHNIRVENNYLYAVPLQLGYNAPENEDCEVRGNLIFKGGLSINKFKKVTEKDNLVVTGNSDLPREIRHFWLPNKYDSNRAHLVTFNWNKQAVAAIPAQPFLKPGDRFKLMDPKNLFGQPLHEGEAKDKTIQVPMAGEFGVFVVLKTPYGV